MRGTDVTQLLRRTSRLSHGTTVGINAIVSRTGARVGLITTKGHGDSLRILNNTGRTNGMPVERILDYAASDRPQMFVARGDVAEVKERIEAFGDVVVPLDMTEVAQAVDRLLGSGVETLAVSLLWSQINHSHERTIRNLLRQRHPGVYVSCGSELTQRIGDPRAATAVLNSYIGPLMRDYVRRLLDGLRARLSAAPAVRAT